MTNFDISKCTFNTEKTDDPKLVVYLTWMWKPGYDPSGRGYFSLRAISLTKEHARYAKESAKIDYPNCKVHVEESIAEHLFGESFGNFHRADGDEPPNGWEGANIEEED
jgi:hypothetical protein